MPGTDADGEKEETNRKRSRSEDEVAETAPKQTEQYGDHPVSIQSTSKHDNLSPPVFQINYPFLRSSVKRLKKDASPPPEPPPATKKGADYQKPVKAVKAERKRWEAWGNQDKTLFFEGLNEYGKDFEAIQKYIEQRHKKRGDPGGQVKNKDQVRHLYYRTCHKLFKYITPDKDQSKTANELYALINYGELRKKIKGAIDARTGQKLNELVKKGSTTIRYQQRNTRLRTPTCKALKQLRAGDEEEVVKPLKLPPRVLLELIPKNNAAWTTVQGVAHNPRVRMVVPLRKELGSLLNMLSEKWTPHRIKLLQSMRPASSDDLPQVKLQTVKGTKITPYDQLKGFYIHDKSRVPFYVGLVDPRIKAACSNRKGAVSKAASAMERMASPVESETMLAKQHDAKSPGSPIETEASVANQQDPHSEMDFVDRTTSPSLQSREWLEEPSAEGDIDLALPTEFTPISMTEITDNFSVPSNQMDHTRIEVSNHRRKIWEEEESAEMGNGNNVENVEQYLSSPDKDLGSDGEKSSVPEQSKDERIQAGVTKENVGDMAITDVYLMLGMPKVVKLAYDFVHAASSQPKARLLDRLTHLAKTEFRDLIKPVQMVSVGVATSPTRLHIPPRNAETPPSKSNAPNQGKSPIPNRATMSRGRNTIVTPKSSRANAPIIVSPATAAAAVAKACEARGVANGPQTRRDKAIFLAPKPVAPRRITPTPANGVGEAERLFKAQLESLQRSDWQLPKRQARKPRGRRPLVVQRTLLPRPQSDDIRHMMTMSIVSNSSRASTGQFMPMKIVTPAGPESPQQQQQSQEPAVISNPSSPMPIAPNNIVVTSLVASTPKSTANSGTNGIDLNSPVASPLGSIFISSPVASPVTVEVLSPGTALSPVALSPMPQSPAALSPAAALSPVAIEVSNAGSPLALTTVSTLVTNSMTQNALITDPLLSTPPPAPKLINTSTLCTPSPLLNKSTGAAAPSLTISPPNISSLLDISLPSAESASSVGTDSLIDSLGLTGFGNAATTDSTGFCQPPSSSPPSPPRASGSNTPPLTMTSPSSSPFKLSSLGPDNQWLNGEAADISFSSILANLESPEKKDKPSSTGSLSTPLVASSSPPRRLSSPPPTCPSPGHNFMENSRDSSLLGKDVDSHLFQCMMNENSIDYVAKFADLAAHISASTEPPKS